MEFGIAIIPYWGVAETMDLVKDADKECFDYVWICDQTFFIDPFPFISAANQNVSHATLGVGVTNPYTRTPYQIARTAGMMGELQGEPLILGVGAGNRRELLTPLGLKQIAAPERIREFIELIRRLTNGESVTYKSGDITMKDVSLKFKVHHPPIYFIAGRGPLTLRLGGEVADGVIIGDLVSDAGLDYAFDQINKGLKVSGRRRDALKVVSWTTCFIADSDHYEDIVEKISPWIAHNLAASPLAVQSALCIDEDRAKLLRSAYAQGGADEAAKYVDKNDIDKLSIVGTPEQCANTIKRLASRGIDQLTILMFSEDIEENCNLIYRLSHEVFPLIR